MADTLLSSTLTHALNAHRDNDTYIQVPLETGGHITLGIRHVEYNPDMDVLLVVTAPFYNGPEDGDE